jgi:hypothetical protein
MTNWRTFFLQSAMCLAIIDATLAQLSAQSKRPSRESLAADRLRQKQQPVKLSWAGVGLRRGLSDLARVLQVSILLDRRIDPEQPIHVVADRLPLDELLVQIAGQVEARVTWLGPLAYIGPREATARLRTLAALRASEARELPKNQRTPLQREQSWHWEALAEPRLLAIGLGAEAGIQIEAADLIPHDLWPAADLPPLSWTDRLSLVANEFDLTYEIGDGPRVRLTPIVEPVRIERSYPGGKQPAELAARWRQLAPDAQIEVKGGKLVVRGRVEDHEFLTRRAVKPPAAVPAGVEVYTMTVPDQPLRAVLETLQRRLSIEIVLDEEALKRANIDLDQRISFSVEKATLDELLAAAFKDARLTFQRTGKVFKIVPAPTKQ